MAVLRPAFLHAANAEVWCVAVKLFCDHLAEGASPEDLLLDPKAGYSLGVRKAGGRRFTMAFGCVPGPLVASSAELEFAHDDEAVSRIARSGWPQVR